MRIGLHRVLVLIFTTLLVAAFPGVSLSAVACGQTITRDTTLTADLACPPGTDTAIIVGASDVTLDLGGYSLSGPYIYQPAARAGTWLIALVGLQN